MNPRLHSPASMQTLRTMMRSTLAVAVFAPSLLLAQATPAADTVQLKEWDVPWERSTPRDPSVDQQGRVWFVGQRGNFVARLDPASGKFTRFEIDSGTHPHTVNVDRFGDAWYAGNRNGMIGRINGKTGEITRYPMPDTAAKDPHTIAFDPQGNLWFTLQMSNMLGFLDRNSGKVTLVKIESPRARPYGIELDAKGRPWFNLFGTNKIATIDPTSMRVREYDLPHERARGRRIAITTDGAIWYVDYARGYLGKLDPASGNVREWALPGGDRSLPYAMTVDDYDRIWLVETGSQPNKLVGFDPKNERFFSTSDVGPAVRNTIRHMVFDPKTRSIWFGTDRGTVGRAIVPKGQTKPIG